MSDVFWGKFSLTHISPHCAAIPQWLMSKHTVNKVDCCRFVAETNALCFLIIRLT